MVDEKQLKRKARELLDQGITKQEAYEQLILEFGHPTTTAGILKRIPSKQAWSKYGVLNHLLSGLMILLFLIVFLPDPAIGTFIWYGLPTIAILLRKTKFYFWVAILAFIGTIGGVAISLSSSAQMQTAGVIRILILLVLLLPAGFLAIWLPKKLTPEPEEETEFYENELGQQRSRTVFKFVEQ
jgi:ABC-type transport system involved in multi-copper enzyme maturation permease subunit